jgi:hypothetical protein
MEDAYENGDEALLYGMKVLESQLTFIKLAVEEDLFDNGLNMSFYSFWRRVLECPGGCLDCVGKHHYACLFCLGFRA